jgi:hypothetical protein
VPKSRMPTVKGRRHRRARCPDPSGRICSSPLWEGEDGNEVLLRAASRLRGWVAASHSRVGGRQEGR